MRRDDRFSGPTTHVSPTALNRAQNAQKSDQTEKTNSQPKQRNIMQTTEKQRKESGKVQLSLLVAVVLACASAGVWSELRAAAPSTIVSRSISANSADFFTTAGQIFENGDGTAFILVFAPVGDTQALGTIFPAVTNQTLGVDYTIST